VAVMSHVITLTTHISAQRTVQARLFVWH